MDGTVDEETKVSSKIKDLFLNITGWLIPLIVSGPSLFIWAGLMTMPLVVYLVLMFLSLFNPNIASINAPKEPYIVTALTVLMFGGPYWPDRVISILSLALIIYATIYLNIKRKKGLVTTGPYRFTRNPQYLGAILFIINLTSRSYREVLGDVGWLGPTGTLLVWFATLAAYILLAYIEELHMTQKFGETYRAYKNRTPFLIPWIKTQQPWLERGLAFAVPILLLWVVVSVNRLLYP